MFRKGHKLFSIASIGLIAAAILQLLLYYSVWLDELGAGGMLLAMQAYRFEFGPGDPSLLDSHESLNLALAVMLLWCGLLNLLVARYTAVRDKLMRRSCTLSIIMVTVLMALFGYYQMLLAVICLAITWILFFVARFRLRRSRRVDAPLRGPNSTSQVPMPVVSLAPTASAGTFVPVTTVTTGQPAGVTPEKSANPADTKIEPGA